MTQPRIIVAGRIPDAGLDVLRPHGNVWGWKHDEPIEINELYERIAGADAVPWTGKIVRLPNPRSSPARTSASASARQINVSTPPVFRIRRAARVQLSSVVAVATCAVSRPLSGEDR